MSQQQQSTKGSQTASNTSNNNRSTESGLKTGQSQGQGQSQPVFRQGSFGYPQRMHHSANSGSNSGANATTNRVPYRTNSWTSGHNQQQNRNGPNNNNNAGSSAGVANRSQSFATFHPPLCIYTPQTMPGVLSSSGLTGGGGGPGVGTRPNGTSKGLIPPRKQPTVAHLTVATYHALQPPQTHPQQYPYYYSTAAGGQPQPATNGGGITTPTPVASARQPTTSTATESLSTSGSDQNVATTLTGSTMKSGNGKVPVLESPSTEKLLGALNQLNEATAAAGDVINNNIINDEPVWRIMSESDLSVTHNLCVICCKMNGRFCTGCRKVSYCSETCQKVHWPDHKWVCQPPVMIDKVLALELMKKEQIKETNGQEKTEIDLTSAAEIEDAKDEPLVAENCDENEPKQIDTQQDKYNGKMRTRKVIKESDLLAAIQPTMVTCCSNTMFVANPPDSIMCLACTRFYQASLGYRCSICRWPVCSVECEKSYLHSNFECKVFSSSNKFPPLVKDHGQFFNDAILVIRCLLLKTVDPEKYQELFELIDVCKGMDKKEDCIAEDKRIVQYLRQECGIDEFTDLKEEEILDFMNVIDACTIIVQDRVFMQTHDHHKAYYSPKFVFSTKMFVSENCIPNSKWSIKYSPKFEECFLRIHAAVDMNVGDCVKTCFSNDRHVIGSWFQMDLTDCKFRDRCKCERCQDPTERGTFFSGVVCEICVQKKETGFLLVKDPMSPTSSWECNNENCKNVWKPEKMRKKVLELNAEIGSPNNHEDFYALVALRWQLHEYLHPNHFLLLKISVTCVMLFWGSVRGLPFFSPRYDFFISTIQLAHEALRVYDMICPGLSIQRARILFQLQVAYAYKHLRDIRRNMEWGVERFEFKHKYSPTPGIPQNFWELKTIQESAYDILKTEPPGTMEREMGTVLREVIDDQIDLLNNIPRHVNLDITAVYNLHKIYTRFSSQCYYPAMPVYEDKEINEFVVTTGPCVKYFLEKNSFPI